MNPLRRAFQRLSLVLTPFVLLASLLVGYSPSQVGASSHREAPLISKDPSVDNVDVYAYVSPDAPTTVTMVATWIPFEEPGGGPNFYHFDDLALYNIKVDRNGDGIPDLTYEWTFKTRQNNPTSWLYNNGPITDPGDPNFLYTQYYTLTEVIGDNTDINGNLVTAGRTVLFSNVQMAPDNIGPSSTPNYEGLAAKFIQSRAVPEGTIKEFTGQRQDPFYVDVNSIFDLGTLRPFAPLHIGKQRATPGLDSTAGYNIHANIIQVPISRLAPDCDGTAADPDCVVGVWSSSDRPRVTTRLGLTSLTNPGGEQSGAPNQYVQVSRLGMPLVNEVVIPLGLKDAFNALKPQLDTPLIKGETAFGPAVGNIVRDAVLKPELQQLLPVLYPTVFSASNLPSGDRLDLFTIFLTGIPGVNQQRQSGNPFTDATKIASEQLRLNMGLKPNAKGSCFAAALGKPADAAPSRLGALEGDLCGFPNGRRLGDDVTDIALRAVAGGYGPILGKGCPTSTGGLLNLTDCTPGNALSDGVDKDDRPNLSVFPYVGTPHSGYNRVHAFITELVLPVIFKQGR